MGALGLEHLGDRPMGIGVRAAHGPLSAPPGEYLLEVLEACERAAVQQVLLSGVRPTGIYFM
jgi:hypothetical protein